MNISININGDDCQAAPVELSASFVREFVKEEWPDEDYPSLTIMQSEHGKGLNPTIQIVEYVGEDQLKVKQLNDSEVKYVYIVWRLGGRFNAAKPLLYEVPTYLR